MFAINPYPAERQVKHMAGPAKWQSCRVLGMTIVSGDPHYLIEVYENGTSMLTTASFVRRPAR